MSKILLVEDNPDAVKRIIRYINKIFAELDVVSFPEAGDALQYAKANDISLFILDIQLSGVNWSPFTIHLLAICGTDSNRGLLYSIHGKIDNHGIGFSLFDCRTFCHLQNARSASVPACDQIAATPEFHRRRNLICHLIADNLNYT